MMKGCQPEYLSFMQRWEYLSIGQILILRYYAKINTGIMEYYTKMNIWIFAYLDIMQRYEYCYKDEYRNIGKLCKDEYWSIMQRWMLRRSKKINSRTFIVRLHLLMSPKPFLDWFISSKSFYLICQFVKCKGLHQRIRIPRTSECIPKKFWSKRPFLTDLSQCQCQNDCDPILFDFSISQA